MRTTRIDERGRVTLPKKLREDLTLLPGDIVLVEKAQDGIVVRRVGSTKEIFQRLRGVITAENVVGKLDPMELKRLLRRSD